MAQSMHPSVDVYQIHRTPFFRRIHRKDPDQFERLKNAYESIRSFDEKPLQMQVKKIRLGKLFRRIKDSLTVSKTQQNKTRPRPKTQHQIRCEELARARQVGIDYSRNNLNVTSRSPMPVLKSKLTSQERQNSNASLHTPLPKKKRTPQDEWMLKNSLLKRRLEYGNRKSKNNRSKTKQSHSARSSEDSFNNEVYSSCTRPPISSPKRKKIQMTMETIRKLLVHCLFEDEPDPGVISSVENIALTKNHSYWDLMGAIKKQQQYTKRYGEFTKNLSKIAKRNVEQNELLDSHVETFKSTTNIRTDGHSEIFIRTYRYSDEDEYLPPPSESLLEMPQDFLDFTNESPTRDDSNKLTDNLNGNYSKKHLSISSLNSQPHTSFIVENDQDRSKDLPQKFGDIIRKTVRTESEIMLANLEKDFKH